MPITTDARATNGGASSSPESPDSPTIEVHRLSLLDRKRYVKRLMVQIPPLDAARALVYQVWDMEASEAVLMRCERSYHSMVDYSIATPGAVTVGFSTHLSLAVKMPLFLA